jgi:hypothetical protein
MLKPFVELACEDTEMISKKILEIIEDKLELKQEGWIFLDTKEVISKIPELLTFFKRYKLIPMSSAVVILYNDLPLHVDPLPIVAKFNFPIANTGGWVNRWHKITEETLATLPVIVDKFGQTKEDISNLNLELITELYDLPTPVVFNSRLAHSVIKIDPVITPRVIASFTFKNDPVHLLK